MYYVYVLENTEKSLRGLGAGQSNKSLYIGFTDNLERRIFEHQSGQGGRTTKLKKNWNPIYFEGYLLKEDALGREKFLKGDSARKYLKK